MTKRVVAVLFGGRSCEHEVSILTAHEAMAVLRAMPEYDVVPIYLTKDGRWLTGPALQQLDKFAQPDQLERECRPMMLAPMAAQPLMVQTGNWANRWKPVAVDVVLPLLHGPNGEDGTLQGLLEMLGLPFAGSGVMASALCMNKVAMKRMFASFDLPQVPYVPVVRGAWESDRSTELAKISTLGERPVFVKPARGGSSIGTRFVEASSEIGAAIDFALRFDDAAVVELALTDAVEINCAVLRDREGVKTSALEAVRAEGGFLTYDQKYLQWSKGSPTKVTSGHEVPARVTEALAEEVARLAKTSFEACECDGVARVDFLVQDGNVYVNEINTLPGSLAFYLWEAAGTSFEALLDSLIESALATAKARESLTFRLDRNLLADIESRKGVKSK